jgi:hypothetical protein
MSFGPGTFGRFWLASGTRNLGLPPVTLFSPVASVGGVMLALVLRLGVLVRGPDRTTKQSPCSVRLNSANEPASAVRCFVAWAGRTHVALSHTQASFSPDASLEVFAPSARSNRDALSDAAKRSDDPASAFFALSQPARPRTFATMTSNPSRSGVALAVFRSANVNAVMLAVGLVARFCAASKRRFKRLATRLQSSVRAVSGVTGLIALTSDPSHQALPHYIGRSRAIMHRRVP